ncbi:MAG: polyprenyl diphosphate synthase [Nitrososphaerota archaeon]|nr:polyprenyl diphosphate synthase [Candidatus Bathyarchaeota archaeon]MDW8048583.1 polyprenyl diphosphate synthase [Nitrososphaerota archaeon]
MLKTLLSILGVYRLYERWLWHQIKDAQMPEHIAIILDGNRRWAVNHSLNPSIGHHYGADKTEDLLRWCLELGVKTVTLYAFSTENFSRPKDEVEELMRIFKERLEQTLRNEDIHRHRVKVKAIGRLNMLPPQIQELVRKVEEMTKDYNEHFLNIAMAYGGRAEIVDAAKKIAMEAKENRLTVDEINENLFEKYLYTAHLPKQDPDLIIRTSGEERLSGFLLYQSAYSELCFLDVYWPEFRKIDLLRAIRTFQKRKRRFGK